MERSNQLSRRGFLGNVVGGAVAFGALGAWSSPVAVEAGGMKPQGFTPAARVPPDRIGLQLFTVRDLMADNMLGLEGTLALLADVGIKNIEIAGDYRGQSLREFRALAEKYGIRVAGNHFGPRSMGGENPWYAEAGRRQIFAEANELGLEYVGTGHYYIVPLTVDKGFKEFARTLNTWGRAASEAGLKFYFHNHDGEFTRFDNRPIFDILLEETDPAHVYFELDLGWTAIAGEDVYALVRRHQQRFPYFHVKDFRFDPNGPRETKPGTLAAGQIFSFADIGKGQMDWPRIFSALENPAQHVYIIERDDAGSNQVANTGSPRPSNPAGSANTVWTSYKYLADLNC